jgi:transcriptional regulator with XRE-family HTH domain
MGYPTKRQKNECGSSLACLREAKGSTQQTIADYLGVSRGTVHTWERGGSFPSDENIDKLCVYYGVERKEIDPR